MEVVNGVEVAIANNSLRYLSNIDSFLNSYKDVKGIRSYYLQKFKKLELQQLSNLPAKLIKPVARCPKCNVTRRLNCTSYRIHKRRRQSRFGRRLVRKMLNLKRFTRFQRAKERKLRNYMHNKLLIQCLICNKKIEEELNKTPVIGGGQGKVQFREDEPVQVKKQPVQLLDSKKGKGKIKKNQKNMTRKIKKNKVKTAEKFVAMLSSKPIGGKSASLKDFLKSL